MIGYYQLTMQNLIVIKKNYLTKVVFIKKDTNNMLYSITLITQIQ